jgi:hypothetical protein
LGAIANTRQPKVQLPVAVAAIRAGELVEQLRVGERRRLRELLGHRQDQAELGREPAEVRPEDVGLDAGLVHDDDLLRGVDVQAVAEAAAAGARRARRQRRDNEQEGSDRGRVHGSPPPAVHAAEADVGGPGRGQLGLRLLSTAP